MKRRIKLVIVCICISLFGMSSVVSAGTVDDGNDVGSKASNYTSASASISISGGTAKCTGSIKGIVGKTTKTSVHLYLQKYSGSNWINVADWSSSGNTVTRSLSKSKSVTNGYKYRTKAVCKAWVGSKPETVTKISKTVSY